MSENSEDHNHGHSFDPDNWRKLESDERRARMDPAKLVDAMALAPGDTVIDIGVGTGFFAMEAAPRCGKLIGIDHSPRMLQICRSKEAFTTLGNLELREGKAESLPMDDGVADVVFHVNLFHEVADMKKFHQHIRRALKPGGRLYMADWRAVPTQGGPPQGHRISEEQAMIILQRDGFTNIRGLDLYEDHYVLSAISG
ncbi:MAG: methyltransferase domain-containing protein [Nitrospinota bacterium]|nr:methyltransferase domain-containing protein [Nitrospinota bacterium]